MTRPMSEAPRDGTHVMLHRDMEKVKNSRAYPMVEAKWVVSSQSWSGGYWARINANSKKANAAGQDADFIGWEPLP